MKVAVLELVAYVATLIDRRRTDRGDDVLSAMLDADLSVDALAARAGMSPRNFARAFVKHAGITPAKFVERARTEQARRRLEDSGESLKIVAGVPAKIVGDSGCPEPARAMDQRLSPDDCGCNC